ncbi:MAG: Tyrosine-tRNA ligase [Parcubacteria group bacterium GW2011_GWC2_39_14]|nr:MAG: Tyrosine-tRNA ligase [Parcubacteria group bacterium GW2011_GWC2_39_14]KKR55500.1 MAG: Tyrosine-tRNA ligase [Parcubacteria group bacterium GW2011_GWA2_40_23]
MPTDTDSKKIEELLTRGVEEVIDRESLKKKLQSGKKLRIKFGVDPTSPDLHVGHAVPLRKLRQFQDAGHQVILLIGDYTAMVGDPSGRNETRPMLAREDVEKNMKTYIEQATRILKMDDVELRYNSEWYEDKGWNFIMSLTGKITVARVLDRDDFQKRLKEGSDIQMQEILYPLMQGYDSVELKADVEIGGTDQKFNMLMGRKLQKKYNEPEQDVITIPLLVGLDGEKKMSKSYGNYIALTDSVEEMFGKIMSIPDHLIIKYFELATATSMEKIEEIKHRMENGENPRDLKLELAGAVVEIYYGVKAATEAKENFLQMFQKKEVPDDIAELKLAGASIIDVLVEAKFVTSKTDARRNIEQKGVKLNGAVVSDLAQTVKSGDIIQKGKRFFIKIK